MGSNLRLKMCPWRDFVNIELFSATTSKERIFANLRENSANYLIILILIFMTGSLFHKPFSGVLILFAATVVSLFIFGDKISLLVGRTLDTFHKITVLLIVLLFALYITSSFNVFKWCLGISATVILGHAIFFQNRGVSYEVWGERHLHSEGEKHSKP